MTLATRAQKRKVIERELEEERYIAGKLEDERLLELYGPLMRECLDACDGDVLTAAKLLRGRAMWDRDLWVALHGDTPQEPW